MVPKSTARRCIAVALAIAKSASQDEYRALVSFPTFLHVAKARSAKKVRYCSECQHLIAFMTTVSYNETYERAMFMTLVVAAHEPYDQPMRS